MADDLRWHRDPGFAATWLCRGQTEQLGVLAPVDGDWTPLVMENGQIVSLTTGSDLTAAATTLCAYLHIPVPDLSDLLP